MNVYDFDGTIYKKDSTVQFYLFCLGKNIFLARYIFVQLWYFIMYVFSFVDKKRFKQGFFSFLKGIKDVDKYVDEFWEKNTKHINSWYLDQKRQTDVIISASPEFLLLPIIKMLGAGKLIASRVDKKTGIFLSENCYGEEKVQRFLSECPDERIESFYSDSLSDQPLAERSKNAYFIKDDEPISWGEYKVSTLKKIKKTFTSKEFLGFLFVGGINALNGVLFASLFSLFMHPNAAFIVGYLISLSISYLLNSFLIFKSKLGVKKYIKFCISYIPNFLIQNGLVLLFYNWLGLNKILVYTIAVIIAIPVTFLLLKLFAFGKKKEQA